jgi:hypothetical protein
MVPRYVTTVDRHAILKAGAELFFKRTEKLVERAMRLSGVRVPLYLTAIALMTVLAIALVACSSSTGTMSGATAPAGSGTSVQGSNGTPIASLPPTATPTISVASPGSGEGGAGEFCSNTPDIQGTDVPLPTSIPAYPNAEMPVHKLSQGDPTTQGDMFFVLCTGDTVSSVLNFYLTELPTKGWEQIMHDTILAVEQIQAANGQGTITISIEPDAVSPHTTEIIIQTRGVS